MTNTSRLSRAGRTLAVATICAVVPASAFAAASYVGKWAGKPAQCRIGQDSQDAPLIMRNRGYDQHETHCTFASISRQGSTWRARAQCDVEGDKQKLGLTMSVKGDRLTISYSNGGASTYQRCR